MSINYYHLQIPCEMCSSVDVVNDCQIFTYTYIIHEAVESVSYMREFTQRQGPAAVETF